MVEKNCLGALSQTLSIQDPKTLIVAMEGIENVLKCGAEHFLNTAGNNEFAVRLENVNGVDKIE